MKRTNRLSAAAARLLTLPAAARLLLLPLTACVFLAAASAPALAQERAPETNAPAPPQSSQPLLQSSQPPQSSPPAAAQADEEFELNIDTRRINESDFHAETAVETDGTRGLHLRVGVALRASDIEVLLLGVRGHVRFRASLAPVLRLLDARRVAAPAAAPTTPP